MKAYDLKLLGEKLKENGLDLAEDVLKTLVNVTFDWVEESAKISKTPFDDVLSMLSPHLKKFVLENVDKVDGEEG